MQIVVDSSVLVAALNESDSQHERGVAEIHAASKPIVVPEYIVAETCAVLIQKANKRLADSFVREMGSNRDFRILFSTPEFFIATAQSFLSSRAKLSFVDSALLVLSRTFDVRTFDKALAKAIRDGGAQQASA